MLTKKHFGEMIDPIRTVLCEIVNEAGDGLNSHDSIDALGHLENIQEIVSNALRIHSVIPKEVCYHGTV